MAQAIVSPENLTQAVEELKTYIDGLRTSISFKDVPIKVEDSHYKWYVETNANYINKGLSGDVFEADRILCDDLGLDSDNISSWINWGNVTEDMLEVKFHFSVDAEYKAIGALIKNATIGIYDSNFEIHYINIKDVMFESPNFDSDKKIVKLNLYVPSINSKVDVNNGVEVSDIYFDCVFCDFYKNSFLGELPFPQYSFITDSNLYICDSSRIINSENKSMYYLYIERWDSKKHKWSIFMEPEGIHPICLNDLETDDGYYYKVPWSALEIISRIKSLKNCPNMLIRIGLGVGFTYDGFNDNTSYNNARFVYKYNPIFVKIRSLKFLGLTLRDTNSDVEIGGCNTLQFHFSTITKCDY